MSQQSQSEITQQVRHIKRLARIALLSAVALVLSFVETMIPLPFAVPGIKLGLANAAVLVTLYAVDGKSAACVALVKVVAVGFLFGSPTMLAYSLSGTVFAFAGMLALKRVPWLEVVPVSMVAAILHNGGQLCAAAVFLQSPAVFVSMLPLGVAACITGFLTGLAAQGALGGLNISGHEGRPSIDLSGISLEPGKLVAFVGPNGSGKSSAALQLAGLSGGETGEMRSLLGTGAGIAFQDPDDQIVALLVGDDVAFGLENQGVARGDMAMRVGEALSQMGLGGLEMKPVSKLSGGQKQQVAMAGLSVCSFPLLVVDEGSAMLDKEARSVLMRLLRDFCSQGVAVVMITQLMDEAFQSDTMVVFQEGRIVAQDTPSELRKQPDALLSWGLELPEERRSGSRSVMVEADNRHVFGKTPLLMCQNLSVAYEGQGGLGPLVVSEVGFELHAGDVVSLMGPSGCGKTTLLRALAGELAPSEGTVMVNGVNLWIEEAGHSPDQRRYRFAQQVGLCQQMPERALFAKTAFEDVAFGPRNMGLPEDQVQALAEDALRRLHIDPSKARQQASCCFSGGEQRRIALAAVLACQPSVLLLDEPTAGLDPVERESLMDVLSEYAAKGGAVLFATHDDALAQQAYSGVICLEKTQKEETRQVVRNGEGKSSVKALPFGVYREGESIAHGLHPSTKLVFCLLLMAAGFCAEGPLQMGALGVVSALALICSRISPKQIGRMLAPFGGLMLFVALFDAFFAGGSFEITVASLQLAVENILRFSFVMLGSSVLMYTTSPTALSDGIYRLLAPLSQKSPWVDDLSCALGLTFRFTPLLVDEFFQVKSAQQAKLARFDGSVRQRLKALVPVFTVLFARSLRRSDTLALALVNRGYCMQPGIIRTCFRVYTFGAGDICALLAGAMVLTSLVVL